MAAQLLPCISTDRDLCGPRSPAPAGGTTSSNATAAPGCCRAGPAPFADLTRAIEMLRPRRASTTAAAWDGQFDCCDMPTISARSTSTLDAGRHLMWRGGPSLCLPLPQAGGAVFHPLLNAATADSSSVRRSPARPDGGLAGIRSYSAGEAPSRHPQQRLAHGDPPGSTAVMPFIACVSMICQLVCRYGASDDLVRSWPGNVNSLWDRFAVQRKSAATPPPGA